jgi:hypothetical protein
VGAFLATRGFYLKESFGESIYEPPNLNTNQLEGETFGAPSPTRDDGESRP